MLSISLVLWCDVELCEEQYQCQTLSELLEEFVLSNSIIDTSLQKGFLRGVNSCMEHMFAVQSIISNAQASSLPLSVSFIDLKNAFGSVSHPYIFDMLDYLRHPQELCRYVKCLYSSLSAHVASKDWNTSPFAIEQGVF